MQGGHSEHLIRKPSGYNLLERKHDCNDSNGSYVYTELVSIVLFFFFESILQVDLAQRDTLRRYDLSYKILPVHRNRLREDTKNIKGRKTVYAWRYRDPTYTRNGVSTNPDRSRIHGPRIAMLAKLKGETRARFAHARSIGSMGRSRARCRTLASWSRPDATGFVKAR